ncbi:MAG: SpoIIE family protein phosphatase [Clostridia bacterium]|nr:SpoIIE family protein phosphatase [Clostridia bacterium]
MNKGKKLLYALIASALITLLCASNQLKRTDRWAQDSLFQTETVPSGDIIIVGIDDYTLDSLGLFPTNYREYVAYALEELAADPTKKPAAVAIDVLYAGYTNESADRHLANAAAGLGNVICAAAANFGDEVIWEDNRAKQINASAVLGYEEPYAELKAVTKQGHINAMCDMDGVMRHALLYIDVNDERVYSMAYEAASAWMKSRGQELKIKDPGKTGHFYVPYSAKPGGYYDGFSLAALIAGRIPADAWAGKIVLIGPYAATLQDSYFTPIEKSERMFGVEIQANVIQSLIDGKWKTEVSEGLQLAVIFIVSFFAAFALLNLDMLWGLLGCAVLAAGGVFGSIALYSAGFVTHPLWIAIAVVCCYLLSLVLHYVTAAKERYQLRLEKERIGAELSLAARIQESSLIKEFPAFPDRHEFDAYALMAPAKEVGGDLYDLFMTDEDHLVMVIGDVSGKGVPAALFMMVAMSLIRHVAMEQPSPAKALEVVNREICARNPAEMFVTVWLGVLEISTGKLTCANAGHEYPCLKHANGCFELIKDKHGFVVGGMDMVRYKEYSVVLEKGAKVFVYTDGVPEATNANEQMFGTERMLDALHESENASPEAIVKTVRAKAEGFTGTAAQFDDMTMLCFEYKGPEDFSFGG